MCVAAIACYFASVHSLLRHSVEFWGQVADSERVLEMQESCTGCCKSVTSCISNTLLRTMKILTPLGTVCFQRVGTLGSDTQLDTRAHRDMLSI